jgi:hypothetical protein
MWWKHHRTTFSPNAQISWREFTKAFRGVYIPPGLVEMKLGEFLALNQGTNNRARFNDFISDCLKQEKNNNAYTASKTRKRAFESGPSQSRVFTANRSAYRPSAPGARFRPPQHKIQNYKGPQKPYKMVVPPARIAAATGQGNSKGAIGSAGIVKRPCYNCDQPSHFLKFCPYPLRKKQ